MMLHNTQFIQQQNKKREKLQRHKILHLNGNVLSLQKDC